MAEIPCLLKVLFPNISTKIHVEPNKGTQQTPLLNLKTAQIRLRASGKLGVEPCVVWLEGGVYRLESPLQLGVQDGGSASFPVVWKAVECDKFTLTGAQELDLKWMKWKDGIYRAPLKREVQIDQLFINEERQILARYPDFGVGYQGKKADNAPYAGCAPDAWTTRSSRWAAPQGGYSHGMHSGLWGSVHHRVLGRTSDGTLKTEGGWQNNRINRGEHKEYRMAENLFEELDAPGEWFHHLGDGILYFRPSQGIDLNKNLGVEVVFNMRHLIEIHGDVVQPIATMTITDGGNGIDRLTVQTPQTTQAAEHIRFEGITFTGTARTFMETKEPLLRSDWSIYRGGAIHMMGTENVSIHQCRFIQLGGNAVFVDGYNRGVKITSSIFSHNGASDINFVGSPAAVRSPKFSYNSPYPDWELIDTAVGPKSDDYPADCLVEDCLMDHAGRFEKQVAGVNISMASRITVRHNTIHHTPRAAINVCDGTWGGHLIAFNDCFETVLETHDHGAFNAWGRDRFWHQASPSGPRDIDADGNPVMLKMLARHPDIMTWDAYQTTSIVNNRMQCDHGWDIDLDDGSSNYTITNNLCLGGGLKTREGYNRIVKNNIILGRGYTCNVPYPKPTHDIFSHNILWGGTYSASSPLLWGGIRNSNLFHNPRFKTPISATSIQAITNDDTESIVGDAQFEDPDHSDFTVGNIALAKKIGFRNFAMDQFGVISPALKKIVPQPPLRIPKKAYDNKAFKKKDVVVLGATVDKVDTEAELTATGMFELTGVMITKLPKNCELRKMGFEIDDVLLSVNRKIIKSEIQMKKSMGDLNTATRLEIQVMRGQKIKSFNTL